MWGPGPALFKHNYKIVMEQVTWYRSRSRSCWEEMYGWQPVAISFASGLPKQCKAASVVQARSKHNYLNKK